MSLDAEQPETVEQNPRSECKSIPFTKEGFCSQMSLQIHLISKNRSTEEALHSCTIDSQCKAASDDRRILNCLHLSLRLFVFSSNDFVYSRCHDRYARHADIVTFPCARTHQRSITVTSWALFLLLVFLYQRFTLHQCHLPSPQHPSRLLIPGIADVHGLLPKLVA